VELIAAATLWGLFSAWLLFPAFGVPRMLRAAAATLMWLELVALLAWGYGSEGCSQRPCAALAEAARTAAGIDVPGLAVVVVALAVAHGFRHRRGARRVPLGLRRS
jgi:hypothetical protein